MQTKALLALSTCADKTVAKKIADTLVERRLAACVNILPNLSSVYEWQGKVETAEEALLLIKTTESRYPDLEKALREIHPYELPEIIAVTLDEGSPDYLRWITASLEDVS